MVQATEPVPPTIGGRALLAPSGAEQPNFSLLGRLAAEVAHDLNHWLAIILQAAESIEHRYAASVATPVADRDTASDAAAIRAATLRGAELVRDIVAFGRASAPRKVPVDVDNALAIVSRLAHRLLGHRYEIVLDLDAPGSRVPLAPGELDRILLNLLANAGAAQPDGGTITIRSRVRSVAAGPGSQMAAMEDRVVIEIEDCGSGISASMAERMFEPFFTTRPERGGSGLGLATTRAIIDAAGGTINAQAAMPHGARLVIELPSWAADRGPDVPGSHDAGRPDSGCARGLVLLVDDDEALCRLSSRHLARRGWRVICAESGEAALLRLDEGGSSDVAVIVADLGLPGMDGVRLVQALRLRLGTPGLPAVIASGHSEATIRAAETKYGALASAVLAKPYGTEDLARLLALLVDAERPPAAATPRSSCDFGEPEHPAV